MIVVSGGATPTAGAITAGTMTESVLALKARGARNVYCCATHALFSGPAVERLANSPVDEVVAWGEDTWP